jgi:mono/diheme cytochrome c family protein
MRCRILACLFASLVPGLTPAAEPISWQADRAGHQKIIAPFFADYCNQCHVGEKAKGDFRLDDALPNDFVDPAARGKWREIVNVLNSHEMPPKKAKQPTAAEVAKVVDWITEQTVRAELAKRERRIVLRRLNREEYRNTIRDLIGIDFDPAAFPQDPPAGGFDNNGGALTMSPMHIELYLNAARQILDRALVDGPQPTSIKWRFDPKVGPGDQRRVRYDKFNAIVNGGNNREEGDFVVVHHESWDRGVNSRDYRMPTPGMYAIRIRAAGRVPDRAAVVASADKILRLRKEKQEREDPKGAKYHQEQYLRDLDHFRSDRMYDYGPPRIKLVVQLGPQPRTIAEFDADGTVEKPKIHEFRTFLTTESMGINLEYAYSIPKVLENFWMQTNDAFARPELLIDWFEIEGPLFDAWPPTSHTNILFASPLHSTNERAYAREVLARFMRRAYRRPVTAAEIDGKLAFYDAARKEKSFVEAIRVPLSAVLASPHFLYLVESTGESEQPWLLNDHELASRLSYFLWSSMPDDELAKLADAGKLRDAKVLAGQVDRLLADARSEALVKNFAGQWLGLRDVGANPPAMDLYPQYDRHLETSMVAESEAFFREILRNNLDVRNFIRADFVTINERLARFYGIPDVRGDHFRAVKVPVGVQRGGIVTQASILTITSNGTRTSPVKRGTWIMKTLLGIDPGLPVANAGEIAPKVPGIDKATVRKRLEIHRQLDQCARCHNKIDPLGFALENYNAAGEWREQEGFGYKGRIERDDPKIDASSTMPDGTAIVGVAGLQKAMLAKETLFLECLAGKLATYALGRELGLADQPLVKACVADVQKQQYTLRSLIHAIVRSEAFRTK